MSIKEFTEEYVNRRDSKFRYQLLARMTGDCEYWLGFGNRCDKHLWALNPADHIAFMKALWNSLDEKPQWLTMERIEDFEKRMTA